MQRTAQSVAKEHTMAQMSKKIQIRTGEMQRAVIEMIVKRRGFASIADHMRAHWAAEATAMGMSWPVENQPKNDPTRMLEASKAKARRRHRGE
jgi:hypothetical protein